MRRSRAEWVLDLLAAAWSHLLLQFDDDTSDDQARDLAAAQELIRGVQLEVLEEDERRLAAWRRGGEEE